MTWKVLERLRGWFSRSEAADDSDELNPGETGGDEATSSLFHCRACNVTFISREMELCPRCDRVIEEIESERKLDRFHLH